MSVVREFMTTNARCIPEDQTLEDAARKMKELDCGSLPICGNDGKLSGFITDRDIVVKVPPKARTPVKYAPASSPKASPTGLMRTPASMNVFG